MDNMTNTRMHDLRLVRWNARQGRLACQRLVDDPNYRRDAHYKILSRTWQFWFDRERAADEEIQLIKMESIR